MNRKETIKERKWEFVHDVRGGWWLRLTNDEDVIDYIKATNDRYDGALCKAVHEPIEKMSLEDRIKAQLSGDRNYMFLQSATIMAQKCNTSLYGGFERLQIEFGMVLHKDILENGETFVNSVGGKTFSLEYDQFVWRKDLVFPNYTISDIRIKRFEKGVHYYAYVGDTQLRNGDKIKWNTYEEAYNFAKAIVG